MKAIGYVWPTSTLEPCPSCAVDGRKNYLTLENTVMKGGAVSTRLLCRVSRCQRLFVDSNSTDGVVTEQSTLAALRWQYRRDRMVYALAALLAMLTSAGIALAK